MYSRLQNLLKPTKLTDSLTAVLVNLICNFYVFRTLPSQCGFDKIAEQITSKKISAMIIVGGFEVSSKDKEFSFALQTILRSRVFRFTRI